MNRRLIIMLLGLTTLSTNYIFADQLIGTNHNEDIKQLISQLTYGPDFVVVGNINVSVVDLIKMAPDTAEFSITYLTEGTTPNEASSCNVDNMKALTDFMASLGITKQELVTIAYKNYQKNIDKEVEQENLKQYQTAITVNTDIGADKFLEAVALLEKSGISNIVQQKYNGATYYSFVITEQASDPETTKKEAQQKLKLLEDEFKAKAIAQLTVADYTNQAIGPKTKKEKQYYVENTIKVKVTDFDNLGKIIAKAQSLKMTVNNDMRYSVSDTAKVKHIEKAQAGLLEKLTNKAVLLLGHKSYQLGSPKELFVNENGSVMPQEPFRYARDEMVLNVGQSQLYAAPSVEIQAPSEFEIVVSMTGNFDIIKPIFKK